MKNENTLTKQERADLVGRLMMALDVKAHRLYYLPDAELLALAEQYL